MAKIPNNRKNEDYWKAREQAEQAWISQNLANDEQFNQNLAKYYQTALNNIDSAMEHELLNLQKGHFLNQEVVEATDVQHYQEKAKKIVEEAQKIRQAGNKVTYADFSKSVNDQLRVYNATMRISRLEMLKSQIGLEMVRSGIDVDKALHDKLSQDYIDEVKRQAGILGVTVKPSMWTDKNVAKIIMGQTESANFSQRLWANQAALKAQLDVVVSNGIIQGQNPREMATKLKANVAKTIANYRYVTERLARTESARVQHRAQIDSLIANDYRFCKWHAEPGRCKVCGEIASNDPDGNGRGIYEVDDVPIVPVHPNCRCSISAYWVNGQDNSYRGKHKRSVKQLTDSINSYKDFEKSLKNNFKIEKVVGMDRVPLEHLQKIYGSFSRNFNRFPALKGKMKNIVGYSKASDRALGEYVPKERTMRINVAQINGFSETLNRCVKNNWWTPKKDFTGVIDHEFGHFVQDSYPELNGGGFDDWEDREKEKSWGKRLIYKAIENSGEELSRNTVIQHCSKYGATNDYEMFAEYFSNSSDDKVINEFNKLLNSERCFKEDKK
ncbi:hypothetical protein [Limosilactobacillus reuteri]|uniref:hypothetical protein n=1 Tax=Limosilactobacillus reuteri TaxID=1598 RepID=UPI002B05D36E|nr:hypothetical protein [Limosilactobacillus reuteri]